jgi:glucan phosphorylase
MYTGMLRITMQQRTVTIGTRGGATIEMVEEAGEENFFLFGLAAENANKTVAVQPAGIQVGL